MTKKQKGKEPENIDYIKLKEIEDIIKADVKKDIKAWVWKPIAVLLIILGFFGYTGYEGLRKLQDKIIEGAKKDFQKKVEVLYDEANVSVMVNTLIKENAENMIKEKVAKEINPIITDLKKDQNEYSKTLNEFKKEQEKYAVITLLNELNIKVMNGDKNAFITLINLSGRLDSNHSQLANDIIIGAFAKYFGVKPTELYFKSTKSDEDVIKSLDDESFTNRKYAVASIRVRKMYKQIPYLISKINTETNLEVIGEIERTLDEILEMEIYTFDLKGAADFFTKAWESKKDKLLNKN